MTNLIISHNVYSNLFNKESNNSNKKPFEWFINVDYIRNNLIEDKFDASQQSSGQNDSSIYLAINENVYEYLKRFIKEIIIPNSFEYSRKDQKKSDQYRQDGNKEYNHRNLRKSLELFTQAVLYAPDQSEALALAYGNRSATYYHLKRYRLCIYDLDNALASGFERFRSKNKLLIRKVECLIKLSRNDEAKKLLNQIKLKSNENEDNFTEKLNNLKLSDFYVKEISSKLPYKIQFHEKYKYKFGFGIFSSKVEPLYDQMGNKGRFLRAKEEIQPGDVIITESPYVKVLLKQYEKRYCHNCCRELVLLSITSMPCLNCTNVLYCSMECRKESWNDYHQYECQILPFLHEFGIGHLVFRIFLLTNWQHISTATNDLNLNEKNLESFKTFDQDTLKLNYRALYSLIDHEKQFHHEDLLHFMITAAMLVELLNHTGWLRKNDLMDYMKKKIIKIALRHLCQIVTNAHAISSYVSEDSNSGNYFSCKRIATALYPAISLLNHSCDPNVVPIFEQGCLNLLRASKRIHIGEEISNCYGIHFSKFTYLERKQLLESQYFFSCECSTCKEEIKSVSKDGLNFEKINEQISIPESLWEMEQQLNNMLKYDHYPPRQLLQIGKMADEVSYRYHFEMSNHDRARHYCQLSVHCVEKIYGPYSIEMCNEMVKLTDLAFVSYTRNTFSLSETIKLIKKTLNLLDQFSTVVDCDDPINELELEDSCYFKNESKRLRKLLKAISTAHFLI